MFGLLAALFFFEGTKCGDALNLDKYCKLNFCSLSRDVPCVYILGMFCSTIVSRRSEIVVTAVHAIGLCCSGLLSCFP